MRRARESPQGRRHSQAPGYGATPDPTEAAHADQERGGPSEASTGFRGERGRKPGTLVTPARPKPGHPEGRGLRAAASSPSPTLPGSYRPGDGHGRPELGRGGDSRRDGRRGGRRRSPGEEGAGPSSGLSGAAPGLGPAGDPRGAAERSCGRQRSESRSPRGGSSSAGVRGARLSERELKLLFPHRQGEAQCLVLYEQPSCIYSLPP